MLLPPGLPLGREYSELVGRHRGIASARGDLVLFTDDDVALPERWIAAFVEFLGGGARATGAGDPVLPVAQDLTPVAALDRGAATAESLGATRGAEPPHERPASRWLDEELAEAPGERSRRDTQKEEPPHHRAAHAPS